jgi:hypothetical protein
MGNKREARDKPYGSPSMFLCLYLVKPPVGRMTQESFLNIGEKQSCSLGDIL